MARSWILTWGLGRGLAGAEPDCYPIPDAGARSVCGRELLLDLLNDLLHAATVFDVVLAHGLIVGGLGVRVVEDHHHVRFDRKRGVVAAHEGVLENVADAALAFAGPVVIG